jgi:hypothetical protein
MIAAISSDYKQISPCPGTDKCHIYSGCCSSCLRSVYGGKDNFRPKENKNECR